MPTRPQVETRDLTTPDTHINVTIKAKQSYGDAKAIQMAAFGDVELNPDAGTEAMQDPLMKSIYKPRITMRQAEQMMSITVQRMLIAWDLTEADGSPTPITLDNIEEIFTQEDMAFLFSEIQGSNEAKKKLESS